MEIEKHLRDEIDAQLGYLGSCDAQSEEYKIRVDNLTKLLDRAIEMEKLAREHEDRVTAQKEENDWKRKQMDEDRIGRWIQLGVTVFGTFASTGLSAWALKKILRFEETGTITSRIGGGWINKFVPKK